MLAKWNWESRPRGSLRLSGPRELLVDRSIPAPFELDGQPLQDTLRLIGTEGHSQRPVPSISLDRKRLTTHDEEVVWGGSISTHYGHFLVESMARLWPLLPGGKLEGAPAIFAGDLFGGRRVDPRDQPFMREWLDAFGIHTVELADEPTRFRRMYIPEPALRPGAWISPELRDIHMHARRGLGKLPTGTVGEVLWLSRSALDRNRRVAQDECLLEWLLRDYVRIVHPQTLALAEQVAEIEVSRAVAGIVGSAFYTLLLAEASPCFACVCSAAWAAAAPYMPMAKLLQSDATFVLGLEQAPEGGEASGTNPRYHHRLQIPQILKSLGQTVLPELVNDPLIATLADPERLGSNSLCRGGSSGLQVAVAKAVLEPSSGAARMNLARHFEAEGLNSLALEQYAVVADTRGRHAPEALRAARRMGDVGAADAASPMVKRVLSRADPGFREAVTSVSAASN